MYGRIRKMIAENLAELESEAVDEEYRNGYFDAMEAVEDILDRNGWIPAGKKPPDEYGYYVITGRPKGKVRKDDAIVSEATYHPGLGWLCSDRIQVLAWAERPDPWTGEGAESTDE